MYLKISNPPANTPDATFSALFPSGVDPKAITIAWEQYQMMLGFTKKYSSTKSTYYSNRARRAQDLLNTMMVYFSNQDTLYSWVDTIDPSASDFPSFPTLTTT